MAFQATTVQRKLEKAGFDPAQALELASILEIDVVDHVEQTAVDRPYLDARLDQLQAKQDSRFAGVDTRFASIDTRFAALDTRMAKLEQRVETGFIEIKAELDTRFSHLDAKLAEFRADLIKWMIGMIGGGMLATLVTVLRFMK
jgi:hypothetical protein